jgi:tetratricopeptide repeat protein 21B
MIALLMQAVSSNFAVRETALYHIVNAKVLIASNKLEDARKVWLSPLCMRSFVS